MIYVLNYGLGFEYDKNTREVMVENVTNRTMYGVEMLFRVTYGRYYMKCKYKRLGKIKAGEKKKIEFKNHDIKNIEVMKYTTDARKECIKSAIFMWLSIILYISTIFFFIFSRNLMIDSVSGIIFLTVFPGTILLMDAGARYDHERAEKAYYENGIIKPLHESEM